MSSKCSSRIQQELVVFLSVLFCLTAYFWLPLQLPGAAGPVCADQTRQAPRVPGEFEHQDAILLGCAQMVQFHPQVLVDIVAACNNQVRLLGLVGFEQEKRLVIQRLRDRGVAPGSIEFIQSPLMTMWVRDYGPMTVLDSQERAHFVDAFYDAPEVNQLDDHVSQNLATKLKVPFHEIPLTMEGGELLTNGCGFFITSQRLVSRNIETRHYDRQTVGNLLGEYLGCRMWITVPSLIGEPTGHVDMFITFINPLTVIVGQYDSTVDATNANRLDGFAAKLTEVPLQNGSLRVERIPMPPHDDGLWRTYTNVIYANGRLLVPTYPDVCPELDREALEIYTRLLPDWEIVAIDASDLIRRNGSLHCVTLNLQNLPDERLLPPSRFDVVR